MFADQRTRGNSPRIQEGWRNDSFNANKSREKPGGAPPVLPAHTRKKDAWVIGPYRGFAGLTASP
jgi:hypothetical protein